MKEASIEVRRREAELARERLLATAHELQARLRLGALAEQAADRLREKSERAADGAISAVRKRPGAAAAAAAGVVALIAAGPIARLVRRMRRD